jgi:AraC-like DNA-binding protein
MSGARSLVSAFHTTDVEVAHQNLRDAYIDYKVQLSGLTEGFSYTNTMLQLDDVVLARMQHSMSVAFEVEPFATTTVLQQTAPETLSFAVGRDSLHLAEGHSGVLPSGARSRFSWERADYFAVFLDPVLLAEDAVAADLGPVRLRLGQAVSPAADAHWGQVSQFVRNVASTNLQLANSPLLRRELVRLLNTAALACFDGGTPSHPNASAATPDSVRRAVAYIDAHVAEPIGLAQIAQAARLSPRGLQAAFRRHLDITPLGYLRQARLDHAHRDLLAAEPQDGLTVAAIAARWGFTQSGKFARDYQHRYHTRPAQVLRQAPRSGQQNGGS